MQDTIKVAGFVRVTLKDKDGKTLVDTGFQKNTITNAGLASIAGLVGNTGALTAFTYLALGTDSTAPAGSQTTLGAEIVDTGLARSAATVSRTTTTQTNDTLNLTFTWTATGVKVIQEVGIFSAASVGVMLGRKLTGSITTANTNQLTILYKVTFS